MKYWNMLGVIIGGLHCKSWSLVAAMKGKEDSRGQVFYEYVRVIKDKKSIVFVVELVSKDLLK